MNSKFTFFFIALSLLLLSSCQDDAQPFVISDINLDEELTLEIRESLQEDGKSGLIARLTTSTEYDCQEGKLKNNLINTEANGIVINVVGLEFPNPSECDGRDVAAGDIDLGEFQVNQQKEFQISLLGEIKNSGTILNRSDRVVISLPTDTGDGIVLGNSTVFKVSPEMVWGFIDSETEVVSDSVNMDFINQLESLGRPIEKVGSFGHFAIQGNGAALINDYQKGNKSYKEGFAITMEGPFEELTEMIENSFCLENYRIRMWDGRGHEFSCQ